MWGNTGHKHEPPKPWQDRALLSVEELKIVQRALEALETIGLDPGAAGAVLERASGLLTEAVGRGLKGKERVE